MPPGILAARPVLSGLLSGAVFNFTMYGMLLVYTFDFQDARHYSAARTGLAFLPLTLTAIASTFAGGRFAASRGPRSGVSVGMKLRIAVLHRRNRQRVTRRCGQPRHHGGLPSGCSAPTSTRPDGRAAARSTSWRTSADLRGNPWVFTHDFYLLINVAVGGRFSEYPSQTTRFPQTMLVDYIRVYSA